MSLQSCLNQFDQLTSQDASDLNDMQLELVYEITEGGVQTHNFTLQQFNADAQDLNDEDLEYFIANAGNANPNRKVRKS